jgi:hypothetical protein
VIAWLLAQMSQTPTAQFSGWELRLRFGDAFADARRSGLIHVADGDRPRSVFDPIAGARLILVQDALGLVGCNEDDPDADPIPLEPEDWAQWQLNLPLIAERMRHASDLDGPYQALEERIVQVGRTHDRGWTSVVLGFFPTAQITMQELRTLRARYPIQPQRILVVLPSVFTLSMVDQVLLAQAAVYPVWLDPDAPFRVNIDLPTEAHKQARPALSRRKLEDRWDWETKREKAILYREARRNGLSVNDAAAKAQGIPRTLGGWVKRLEMEEAAENRQTSAG